VRALLFLLLFVLACSNQEKALRLAVAANFHMTAERLVSQYQQSHPDEKLELVTASTGALAAQIRQGAPFDLLLAADTLRPQKLLADGFGLEARIYAGGRLVLWLASADSSSFRDILARPLRLAIANPQTAPYGAAGRDLLAALGVWDLQAAGLVQGESISQTLQLAQLGGLDAALIAASQAAQALVFGGVIRDLPEELVQPIPQAALRLNDREASREFWNWMLESPEARRIITAEGYLAAEEIGP
jgi:molybdate transport system substrate-binding protein